MIPALIAGGAALAGGFGSYFGNKAQNLAMNNAIQSGQNTANALDQRNQNALNSHDWRSRLSASNELRQDANAYETNQAVQGGLAAYGGDPLSGGARTGVMDRLQQMARANYQTSLDNANNMLGADLSNQLNVNEANADRQMNIQNAKLNKAASKQSGASSFFSGAGQALGAAGKILGGF